ncbi:MAG: C-GCAxxG-C-C family protein [Actinobacteria bacterium]|nr:C-GCAxxG-C-C family protein [Actinomycetota bacterium]MBU1493712.1 C-GCAxxG-C-C family protein [Actinomycetota bacterium]
MSNASPKQRIRALFLEDEGYHGCAETALVALQEQFGLPNADDSSPALVLNGGIAYSGSTCGALTAAALAVGRLAAARIPDHREAKSAARYLIQEVMADFDERFGAVDCRSLTGYDMMTDHDAFMADGAWKTACTTQIEFVVEGLAGLADEDNWRAALLRKAVPR